MTRILWYLADLASRLWFRASLYGFIAVVTALAAIYFKSYIPEEWPEKLGVDAIDSILNILASSMLSVTIFSLSTMVAAYSAATNNVTPRATKLLIEDKISHKALATFLGAFIFSIVCIVALKAGVYGDSGRFIIYIVTIGVIMMIVLTLLRWIEYLARLGRVSETIQRVEDAARDALEARLRVPYLGGVPLMNDRAVPKDMVCVTASMVGYVQHIDMGHLASLAEKQEIEIYICALPGKFLDINMPMVMINGVDKKSLSEDLCETIRDGFITGNVRSYRQDPRFGMAVLHEIAIRALSPAINDPGTAIQIIGTGVRLLSIWARREDLAGEDHKISYPRVFVPPLRASDLFDDFFPPIARDGASNIEVQVRLQKAYAALANLGDEDLSRNAVKHAALSMKRAEKAMDMEEDIEQLRAARTL